jgi:hypothetical protein
MTKEKIKETISGVSDENQKDMIRNIVPYFMSTWPLGSNPFEEG